MKATYPTTVSIALRAALGAAMVVAFLGSALGQRELQKLPIASVEMVFEGGRSLPEDTEAFREIVQKALGRTYSAARVRDALQTLYNTGKVERASVDAKIENDQVFLVFSVDRRMTVRKVSVLLGKMTGKQISEDEILLQLNFLSPGTILTEQAILTNVDRILSLLRDRGYLDGTVKPERRPLSGKMETDLLLRVEPGEQARVGAVKVEIDGIDAARILGRLGTKVGSLYTREQMMSDAEKIRVYLRDRMFFAAKLEEPRMVRDSDTGTVSVLFNGSTGPSVKVSVTAPGRKLDEEGLVKGLFRGSQGSLDYSAIIEAERILEERFQEQGYFFADVSAICSVTPPFQESEASYTSNDTELLCSALGGADLKDREVKINFTAKLGNQLRLKEVRIEGLDDFLVDGAEICRIGEGENNEGRPLPISEIKALLGSTEASVIGLVPYLGYGRGYTSTAILEEDRQTIDSVLSELGYLGANVTTAPSVTLDGENLFVTFQVNPGRRTRISRVEVRGNSAFTQGELMAELEKDFQGLEGKGFSRALARNAERKLAEFYSQRGFHDARVNYSIEDDPASSEQTDVGIIFTIENEGSKVLVDKVLLAGNNEVRRDAILKALNIRSGRPLRTTDMLSSEQNLYATDAFKRVEIRTEPAGRTASGEKLADVEVGVQEQDSKLITYGGGYSTDSGPFGSFDVRNFNLFGRLQQGGAQVRLSRFRQLLQADFIDPRFIRTGENPDGTPRYAPLTVTAQYQRDSTVTRFFRSAFDKGTFGIVQRVDEDGNPIDEFGRETGNPTINRLSISAETSRTLSVRSRMLLFVRYRFEDVQLSKFESLLIRDLLRPDSRIRTSGFGVTFARDTRENCRLRYSLVEIATKGSAVSRCRYNPGDATRGSFLTAEYNVSVPGLGASVGFQKFQAAYNVYYSSRALRNTTLAGRAVLGLANVFSRDTRFSAAGFPELEGMLPISERFFGGGSQSLRGFDFESAGPRVVIVPQGIFRDNDGRIVNLNPFTVPFGGNAMALVNVEARIPVSETVRLVPFYDGGNVFRKAGEIFKPISSSEPDVFKRNLRSAWTHTVGFGLRLRTPIGGEFAIDYGYLLKPPTFIIPQTVGPDGIFRLNQGQIHFRFAQAF